MEIQKRIQEKLQCGLSPQFIDVVNESFMHNVPEGSESHFKVTVVSDQFESLSRVARHQSIYKLLSEELQAGVHALAIHVFTPAEWQEKNGVTDSPKCLGG